MSLIASTAVAEQLDSCGISLAASHSTIAVELEDGTINVFGIAGNRLDTRSSGEEHDEDIEHNSFAVVADKLVIANGKTGVIEMVEARTGAVLSSATPPTPPNELLPYHSDHTCLIAPTNLNKICLLSLSPDLRTLDPEIISATASLPPYRIFKHHIAHSLLALLCSNGIVHIWRLPTTPNLDDDGNNGLKSICTLSPTHTLPPLYPSDTERRQASDETEAEQMFSVLIYSPSCILTGHRDGKIRVWDISPALNPPPLSENSPPRKGENTSTVAITTPAHVVSQPETDFVINALLPLPPSSGTKADILSTDTQGFVKLWRLSASSSSSPSNLYTLELVAQHRLFDHAIVCRALTASGKWLLAGGREGGGEEDACGLDARTKALRLDSLVGEGMVEVRELGPPSLAVFAMRCVERRGGEVLVVSLMRRGRAWLEVWDAGGL